jgi:hypothetical protein
METKIPISLGVIIDLISSPEVPIEHKKALASCIPETISHFVLRRKILIYMDIMNERELDMYRFDTIAVMLFPNTAGGGQWISPK